jgi:hypothetical protein
LLIVFHSLCTIETLSTELLNSFKKQEVYVINIRKVVNVAHLFVFVGAAWEAITRNSRKCVCRLAQHIGILTSSAWKTCCSDLSLCLYIMYLSQPLLEDGKQNVMLLQGSWSCCVI